MILILSSDLICGPFLEKESLSSIASGSEMLIFGRHGPPLRKHCAHRDKSRRISEVKLRAISSGPSRSAHFISRGFIVVGPEEQWPGASFLWPFMNRWPLPAYMEYRVQRRQTALMLLSNHRTNDIPLIMVLSHLSHHHAFVCVHTVCRGRNVIYTINVKIYFLFPLYVSFTEYTERSCDRCRALFLSKVCDVS